VKNYEYLIKEPFNVRVFLRAEDPNSWGDVQYTGKWAEVVKAKLRSSTGAFGHIFDPDNTSPIDLDYALKTSFPGRIEVKGELIKSYDPGIPKGAAT
jgi:hypothetical protein